MSINKIDATRSCQPLKQSVSAVPLREVAFKNTADSFVSSSKELTPTNNLEAKYDFACRLAAFYKNQYEQLLSQKSCCV